MQVGYAEIAILSLYLALVPTVNAVTGRCCQHGRRWTTATVAQVDTSLVVSGGVDRGRRRRNVYGKKPQRYAKDNRTARLNARSDKSVAYVTNNKRLLAVFNVLLKLTTDRQEASRGLFATAELFVLFHRRMTGHCI